MKSPSFQFYPGDWQRDTSLRACSVGARGLWIEMICIMHQSKNYGFLQINGRNLSEKILAKMVGCTRHEASKWLTELRGAGVFDLDEETMVCRRMVRDESIRKARAEGGKLGGNPALKVNLQANLPPTPSSSSSSSTALTSKANGRQATCTRFDEFFETYPKQRARKPCLAKWKAKHLDEKADMILADVKARIRSDERWRKGFVPDPLTYINQDRWEDDISP